jgi:hypothetical protein
MSAAAHHRLRATGGPQHEMAWSESTKIGLTGVYCDPDAIAGCDPRDEAAFWPPTAPSFSSEAVRVVSTVLSIGAVAACAMYYGALVMSKKAKNTLPPHATVLGSYLALPFLLEVIVLGVHPFPTMFSWNLTTPNFYLVVLLLPLLRFGLILRFVRYHSQLNSSNGRFIGALTNVEFGSSFILKTVLKERPVTVMIVSLVALIGAAAYAVRVIESVECAFYRDLGCPPMTMESATWLVIITMLTIGYGDVVPVTVGGRIVTIVGGLLGTLLTAVTIALTTEYLQLTRSESKVVTFLVKHKQRQNLQFAAADLIQSAWRWRAGARAAAAAERANKGSSRREVEDVTSPSHADGGVRHVSGQRLIPNGGATPGTVAPRRENKPSFLTVWSLQIQSQRLESEMYRRIELFRHVRRVVRGTDPTDPTDRQLTLLEAIDSEVGTIRDDLEDIREALVRSLTKVRGVLTSHLRSSKSRSRSRPPKRGDSSAIMEGREYRSGSVAASDLRAPSARISEDFRGMTAEEASSPPAKPRLITAPEHTDMKDIAGKHSIPSLAAATHWLGGSGGISLAGSGQVSEQSTGTPPSTDAKPAPKTTQRRRHSIVGELPSDAPTPSNSVIMKQLGVAPMGIVSQLKEPPLPGEQGAPHLASEDQPEKPSLFVRGGSVGTNLADAGAKRAFRGKRRSSLVQPSQVAPFGKERMVGIDTAVDALDNPDVALEASRKGQPELTLFEKNIAAVQSARAAIPASSPTAVGSMLSMRGASERSEMASRLQRQGSDNTSLAKSAMYSMLYGALSELGGSMQSLQSAVNTKLEQQSARIEALESRLEVVPTLLARLESLEARLQEQSAQLTSQHREQIKASSAPGLIDDTEQGERRQLSPSALRPRHSPAEASRTVTPDADPRVPPSPSKDAVASAIEQHDSVEESKASSDPAQQEKLPEIVTPGAALVKRRMERSSPAASPPPVPLVERQPSAETSPARVVENIFGGDAPAVAEALSRGSEHDEASSTRRTAAFSDSGDPSHRSGVTMKAMRRVASKPRNKPRS